MATNGGISLSNLLKMPVRQLNVLRKAVEIERINWRKQFIYDTAMAFTEPQKAIQALDNIAQKLSDIGRKSIIWTSDEDAASRLSQWKR